MIGRCLGLLRASSIGSEVPVPRPRAWRSAAARLPAAAAGWAKSINPLLRHEVEGVHRLGSRGYQTGPSEPQVTTRGRATCTKWVMSTHHAECHDVSGPIGDHQR
eukprot:scaffold37355_cov78-Phaeocystis_antarctica.AAC.5